MKKIDYSLESDLPGGDLFHFRTWDDVADYLQNQVKQKGYTFDLGANENRSFPFTLSGKARAMLGFIMYDPSADENNTVSIKINEETRVETISNQFASRVWGDPAVFQSNPVQRLYIPVPSPLKGSSDSLSIIFNTITATKVQVVFFYI
jgi:hypothetical protein